MSDNQLKPCPFCGGEAQLKSCGYTSNSVYCIMCGASSGVYPLEQFAVEEWNRRVGFDEKSLISRKYAIQRNNHQSLLLKIIWMKLRKF